MRMNILISLLMFLLTVSGVCAKEEDTRSQDQVKTLSGMSVVGNDEAPKALYLVPWKSSLIGEEISLDIPTQEYAPVKWDEFKRKIDYYYIQYGK